MASDPRRSAAPWVFAMSSRDRIACTIVFVALALLNVQPISNSFGLPLAALAAFVGAANPLAAFLFIAGSQIAPDPPGAPLTLAQMFVVAWAVASPFSGTLKNFRAIGTGLRFCMLFMLLWFAIGAVNGTLNVDWAYAFAYALIVCTYVPLLKGAYTGALLMLALGASLGIANHWGTALGLPMIGETYDHLLRGGLRSGSGRGDVNWTSVNVGMAMWTLISLVLPRLLAPGARRPRMGSAIGSATLFVAFAIPLVAMGSRGGYGYLVLGIIFLTAYLATIPALRARAVMLSVAACLSFGIAALLAWPTVANTRLGHMISATLEYNRLQASQTGNAETFSGRAEIWSKFFDIAATYPLMGAPRGAVVDMGEYGTAVVGEESAAGAGAGGTGHNVLLDIAASRGFPLAALFALMFLAPLISLIKRRGPIYALPFIMAHFIIFLAFMNVSIGNYKTYWALHVLTAFACLPRRPLSRRTPDDRLTPLMTQASP